MKKRFCVLAITVMSLFMALPAFAEYTILTVWNNWFDSEKDGIIYKLEMPQYSAKAGGYVFPIEIERDGKMVYKGTAKLAGNISKKEAEAPYDFEAGRKTPPTAVNEFFIITLKQGNFSGPPEEHVPHGIEVTPNPKAKNAPEWTKSVYGSFTGGLG